MATIKSLAALKAAGGIVPREPVLKTVEWTHVDHETGEEITHAFEVRIVRQAFGAMLELGKLDDHKQAAAALSKAVMLEDDKGKPVFLSYEDALQLDPGLALALAKAVREVNDPPKNSQRPTSSFVNLSPAESADAL